MKIWRVINNNNIATASNTSGSSNIDGSSDNAVILGGDGGKTTTKLHQLQRQLQKTSERTSTKEVEQVKKELSRIKKGTNSSHRVPSSIPTSSAAIVVVDDARNDIAVVDASSPKIGTEKKERKKHIISIGRNINNNNTNNNKNRKNNNHDGAKKSSNSKRDSPEGEVTTAVVPSNAATAPATGPSAATTASPSYALSRLLFTKQHMEQRDQMKVVYTQFGASAMDTLMVQPDDGMPSPEHADHVVVKIQASTVTLDDCLIRRGFDFNILDPICLPQTPGYDIVGHICVRGSKVDASFDEGDRVAALIRTGGNARFVSIPSSCLVKIPRNIDSAEAAAMVSTFTTAYQTLKRIKQQGPMFSLLGKRVLILGGMDGVGQALIQMCLKARAEIYAPCPRSCHNYMQNVLGAHPLPGEKDQWLLLVESQMDYVFDGVCEDGLETSQKALTADGELVCYGHSSMLKEKEMGIFGAPLSAHMNKLWSQTKSKATTIDIWESFKEDPETYKKNLKSLCQLLKWNKIKPNITCRVGLSEVADAQAKLENGELHGTIVCLPWTNIDNKATK